MFHCFVHKLTSNIFMERARARENVKWYWRAIFSYLHSEMNGKQWDAARCYATQCKRGVEQNSMAKNVHVNDLAPNRWLVLLKESFHFLVKHDGFTVRCTECLFFGGREGYQNEIFLIPEHWFCLPEFQLYSSFISTRLRLSHTLSILALTHSFALLYSLTLN